MSVRADKDPAEGTLPPPSTPPEASPYTLRELLAQQHFGLVYLTGSEEDLDNRISGAHPIEVDNPTRWLAPEWVMLTTGTRLLGDEESQRSLIRELSEAGVSALGFGENVILERTPPALIAEAESLGFPVFAVPYETPFRDIVRATNQALLSTELRSIQRLSSIQGYLIDSMREEEPHTALIERLARVLGVAVIHVPAAGQETSHPAGPPSAEISRALRELTPTARELEVGPWHVIAVPNETDSGRTEWLAAASRRRSPMTRLTKPALQAAGPLLVATSRLGRALAMRDRATRSGLLRTMLAREHDPSDHEGLYKQAALFGFELDEPLQVMSVRLGGSSIESLDAILTDSSIPWLYDAEGSSVATVLVEGDDLERSELASEIAAGLEGAAVGVGRTVTGLGGLNASRDDSLHALDRLDAAGSEQRVLSYAEFDLPSLILRELPTDRITPQLEELAGVLEANPSIHQALLTYFDLSMDVTAAAAALHLHPNSMRYRLNRAEELLGYSLKDAGDISALYLALDRLPRPGN